MLKIASSSGAPPQTPLSELTTLPRIPIVVRGFLLSAIAAVRAPSALAIFPHSNVLVGPSPNKLLDLADRIQSKAKAAKLN